MELIDYDPIHRLAGDAVGRARPNWTKRLGHSDLSTTLAPRSDRSRKQVNGTFAVFAQPLVR